jgi:hypothetical protein
MLLPIALLVQVSGEQPVRIDPLVRYDLRDAVISKECRAKADEIVVCATTPKDPERNRLREPVGVKFVYDDRAEKEIAPGVNAAIQTEQASLGAGVTSNRLMVRLKMKF